MYNVYILYFVLYYVLISTVSDSRLEQKLALLDLFDGGWVSQQTLAHFPSRVAAGYEWNEKRNILLWVHAMYKSKYIS